jgi:hypothetical protein
MRGAPSGNAHSAMTRSECPSRRVVSAPVLTSHSRIVLSLEPEASRPSDSTRSAQTGAQCPSRELVWVLVSDVPQSDRPVPGARCKPTVRQHAQCGKHIRVPLQGAASRAKRRERLTETDNRFQLECPSPLDRCRRFESAIAAAIRPPTASLAARSGSAERWAYLAVVIACLCPSRAPMIGKLKPPTAPTDA